jgi:hypothetical protein
MAWWGPTGAVGMPAGIPFGVRHVVGFNPMGARTEVTVTEYGSSDQAVDLSRAGLEQTLDKLAVSIARA